MRRLPILAALLVLTLTAPGEAASRTRHLWATVNICDTPAAPDMVGIRASMPGNGTRQVLYMRFEAQWFDPAKERFVSSGASSRWIRVGSARFATTQAGFSFGFGQPLPGAQFTMRGRVDFEWRGRRNGRPAVVRRETRFTRGGIRGVEGGDPPGHSAATCVIR